MSPKKADSGGNLTNKHINKERKFNYSPWVTRQHVGFPYKIVLQLLDWRHTVHKKIFNSFKLHIKGKAATVFTGKLYTKIYQEC